MASLSRISGLCLVKTPSTILRLFSGAISRLCAHWVLGSWCGNHCLLPAWCVAFSLDSTRDRPRDCQRNTVLNGVRMVELLSITWQSCRSSEDYVAPRFKRRGNDQPVTNRILVALGNLQGSLVRLDRNRPRLWTDDAQERRERCEPPYLRSVSQRRLVDDLLGLFVGRTRPLAPNLGRVEQAVPLPRVGRLKACGAWGAMLGSPPGSKCGVAIDLGARECSG